MAPSSDQSALAPGSGLANESGEYGLRRIERGGGPAPQQPLGDVSATGRQASAAACSLGSNKATSANAASSIVAPAGAAAKISHSLGKG
jgi:hypothetical protein